MKPTIRVSKDEDGKRIHELLQHMGFAIDGLDWSGVSGYWLMASVKALDRKVKTLERETFGLAA